MTEQTAGQGAALDRVGPAARFVKHNEGGWNRSVEDVRHVFDMGRKRRKAVGQRLLVADIAEHPA